MAPPDECRGVFEFWRDLAHRMGFSEHFTWATIEDLYTDRIRATGKDWAAFSSKYQLYFPEPNYKKYEQTGFATPTGKVELSSTILDGLGFDPLPYWREGPATDPNFPLQLFMGVREDEYFQTGGRFVPELRARKPEPQLFIHPEDARAADLVEGEWVDVETKAGRVALMTAIRKDMPRGLLRVPHGWWKPEMPQGDQGGLSGAWMFSDAQICPDDEDFLDREQGVPHFKGVPARIHKRVGAPHEGGVR